MEYIGSTEALQKQPVGRKFIAVLWVSLLVFSFFTIVVVTETYLRPTLVKEVESSDWSGYVIFSDSTNPQPVMLNISASWIVPAVMTSFGDTFSDVWIGIGGQLDSSLIQTGTSQDSVNGAPAYEAWYELLPDYSTTITSINVSAGDAITASIGLLDPQTDQWLIQIDDITSGQSFSQTFSYASSRLSAEWIVERPTVNNALTQLANFGSATFTSITVSTDSKSGTIVDFPFSRVTMYDRQSVQLVTVSQLSSQGSTFTVTYLG